MAWLPDGEKSSKISLFVLAQFTNVTDGQTDGQTLHADICRAYASHRAAKILPFENGRATLPIGGSVRAR